MVGGQQRADGNEATHSNDSGDNDGSSAALRGFRLTQIHRGIKDWFLAHPPSGTLIAWQKQQGDQKYVIARGDTLSGIAQRFNVSLSDLKSYNGIRGSKIMVGQTLRIPTT